MCKRSIVRETGHLRRHQSSVVEARQSGHRSFRYGGLQRMMQSIMVAVGDRRRGHAPFDSPDPY
jgi:hypothetical protein